MACEPVPDSDSDGYIDDSNGDVPLLPEGNFANPEGLAVTEDFVIVANSRYRFEEHQIVYDPSFATVIDRNTNEVVNRIPLRAKNAQRVTINGDMAWVLCSGSTSFDGTKVAPTDDGALLGIPIANLAKAKAPEITIPIPLSTIYPLVDTLVFGLCWRHSMARRRHIPSPVQGRPSDPDRFMARTIQCS